jgi:hypothetical protein
MYQYVVQVQYRAGKINVPVQLFPNYGHKHALHSHCIEAADIDMTASSQKRPRSLIGGS